MFLDRAVSAREIRKQYGGWRGGATGTDQPSEPRGALPQDDLALHPEHPRLVRLIVEHEPHGVGALCASGICTVVSDGVTSRSHAMSSKPATDRSSPTVMPRARSAAIAPTAITSLTANTQVAPVSRASSSSAAS